ncbi:MAG: lytic murein transglycosylase B [Gammaproteobacteria bacterium]|nr:lytic murein transglycosylase B [Gammaproteobacteria bacterium]
MLLAGCSTALPVAENTEVREFIREMVTRHGFSQPELEGMFREVRSRPDILRAISRPAEAKPWYKYRPIFLTSARAEGGAQFWHEHRDVLKRAQEVYGVPPEIIVAIIGVETRYGANTGRHRVVDSLTTLAFEYPKRGKFFRGELEQFLLLTREIGKPPLKIKGSYAGAMGFPQFIASSYRHYAVDFSGDGVRDLLGNPVDAIGSVGNYLRRHGWVAGQVVALKVEVSKNDVSKLLESGLKPHLGLDEMHRRGVKFSDGDVQDVRSPPPFHTGGGIHPVPGDNIAGLKGALFRLQAQEGPEYWVGLQNFYTITRYNHSKLYAMAVYQLAQEIRMLVEDGEP